MIIHLVGMQKSNYPYGFENRLSSAIQELGHTLISTDILQEHKRLSELLRVKADLILVCQGEDIDPHLIESAPCVTALWSWKQIGTLESSDNMVKLQRKQLSFNLGAFDFVFSHDPSNLDVYRHLGAEKVFSIPCAAVEPSHNYKLNIKKTFKITFIGSKTERRLKILDALKFKGIDVFCPEISNQSEINKLLCQSEIVLNLHPSGLLNMDAHVANVLGAGSFLLSETLSDQSYIKEGVHYISFSPNNIAELTDKVIFYLTHEALRESIAVQGHEYIKQFHTYAKHLQILIDTVDFSVNQRIWPAYTLGVPTNTKGNPTLRLDRFNLRVKEALDREGYFNEQ